MGVDRRQDGDGNQYRLLLFPSKQLDEKDRAVIRKDRRLPTEGYQGRGNGHRRTRKEFFASFPQMCEKR